MKIKCPFSPLNDCNKSLDRFDMTLHLVQDHGYKTWMYLSGQYVNLLFKIHEKIKEYQRIKGDAEFRFRRDGIIQELKSLLECDSAHAVIQEKKEIEK